MFTKHRGLTASRSEVTIVKVRGMCSESPDAFFLILSEELMKIGLIDVDGHNFPNIPLMKLSAWHKKEGDHVEWYKPLITNRVDVAYCAKVFSFTPDYQYPINADKIIKGGTGYCIELQNSREVYHHRGGVFAG